MNAYILSLKFKIFPFLRAITFNLLLFIMVPCFLQAQSYDVYKKLLAFDGMERAQFGEAVAISDNFALVGAPWTDPASSGAVYIYQYERGDWQSKGRLQYNDPSVSGDWFGQSIAMEAKTAVVGAGGRDDAAYVFELVGDQWVQKAKLTATDASGIYTDFGCAVAIKGNTILVGAGTLDAVYSFNKPLGGWSDMTESQKISPPAGSNYSTFGYSLALDGEYAVIGDYSGGPNLTGSIYIYRYENNQWIYKQQFIPPDGDRGDDYGGPVAIENNLIIVGAPDNIDENRGSVYIYELNDQTWQYKSKLTETNPGDVHGFGRHVDLFNGRAFIGAWAAEGVAPYTGAVYIYDTENWNVITKLYAPDGAYEDVFGVSLDFDKNTVIVGAYGDDDNGDRSGSAYIFELVARPGELVVSNGDYDVNSDWINLTWSARPNQGGSVDKYKIYRNGLELPGGVVDVSIKTFDDENVVPGRLYEYQVTAIDENFWDESGSSGASGWALPNGQISGFITSSPPTSMGVRDIKVNALCSDLCSCLEFDGINDYVHIDYDPSLNPTTQVTVEAWVKPEQGSQVWARIFSSGIDNKLELMALNDNQQRFCFYPWIDGAFRQVVDTVDWVSDVWYHVAGTYDGQVVRLFVNGVLKDSTLYQGTLSSYLSDPKIGWRTASDMEHFKGKINEVRLWNVARKKSQIKSNMTRILTGKESGLIAYWRNDEGKGYNAGDNTVSGGHHAVVIDAIWSSDEFAPVQYSNTTDESGYYNIANIYYDDIDDPGAPIIIKPDTAGGRSFNPDSAKRYLKFSSTTSDYQKDHVDFSDESSFLVSGSVKFADLPYYLRDVNIIIDDNTANETYTDEYGQFYTTLQTGQHKLSPSYDDHSFVPDDTILFVKNSVTGLRFKDTTHHSLSVKVAGGHSGFNVGEATLLITGPENCFSENIITINGECQIKLPALPDINVAITNINGESVETFLSINGGKITSFKTISLVEDDQSVDFIYYAEPQINIQGFSEPTSLYNVPVIEQLTIQDLEITVLEDYGMGRTCKSDSIGLIIFDEISDDLPPVDTVLIDTGECQYSFRVGMPNILPGGSHPYQKRFQVHAVTKGGAISLDQWVIVTGYRPREQTFTTVSPAIPFMILRDPPGDGSYSFIEEQTSTSLITSFSMLEDESRNRYKKLKAGVAFSVSAGGFVSVGNNFAFWLDKNESLTIGASGLSQTEQQLTITHSNIYSTSGEENAIGPGSDVFIGAALNLIYALADVLDINEIGEVELSKSIIYGPKQDDAFHTTYFYTKNHIINRLLPSFIENRDLGDPDSTEYWNDQIAAWQQIINLNDSLKSNAVDLVGTDTDISINGTVEKISSMTIEQTLTRSLEFNMYIDEEVAREAGLEIAGSGKTKGSIVKTRINFGKSETTSKSIRNTVGFRIYDNDDIDYFWFKVKGDPVYGTPVFDLQEGCFTSSPWENSTHPHERCKLDIKGEYIQIGIDPEKEAVFQLELTNTSPSNQIRNYELFDIHTSNPDGAQIKVTDNSLHDLDPFRLTPFLTSTIPLEVKRGPLAYDFEDLQVGLRSVVDAQIADTVTFSVHFTPPCSPVTLSHPQDGWIVNKQAHDSLRIVLDNFDQTKMSSVILQYSPQNRNEWKDAFVVAAASLPASHAELIMSTKDLKDGLYDIRAKVTWNQVQGATYSAKAGGVIDRIAPKAFGDPQPADGVLHPGDNISVKFNENIDQNALSTQNVTVRNARTGAAVPVELVTSEREVIINPTVSVLETENQHLQVALIDIQDQYGNVSGESVVWSFYVNQNPVFWNTSKISKTILEGETCTFWAKLTNNGPEDVNFNLSNIPWLNADVQNGLLSMNEEKIVNFTVDPNILPGYYLDTLFAETAKGNEPLILDIQVQNKPPEWTFDPAAFQYNMTVTAGFYIDNIPFSQENDLVAAFINDQLCGKVKVQKVAPQDEYVAFLMVHSNQIPARVRLVIWDASEGKERAIDENLNFIADTSYGRASEPDSLHIAGALLQNILLAANWNWISLAAEARDMSVTAVLDGLRPANGDLVKGQTTYAQYLPGTGWVGPLDTLRIGNGFKMKLAAPRDLNFIGDPVADIHWPIEIQPGWNWVGYLPHETMEINTALASLNSTAADGDLIKNKNSFASYNAGNTQWEGTLTQMKAGESYQIRVANDGILEYPGPSGKRISLTRILSARSLISSAPEWSLNAADYEFSMNVTSTLSIDGLPVSNADVLLGAFINNVCCGVVKPVFVNEKWIYFSTIFSNNATGDSMQFRVYDAENDRVRNMDLKLEFVAEKVLGIPAAPLNMWIGIPTGIEKDDGIPKHFALEHNYPNPFNPNTTIKYALKQPEHVHLIIYDMLGKKVTDLVDQPKVAGWYEINFDASNLASGVYFYKLVAGPYTKIRKMVLIK